MATALVLLADGFEEIEAVTIIDVLRRGQVTVTTASLSGKRRAVG
jgi:protein deglycase